MSMSQRQRRGCYWRFLPKQAGQISHPPTELARRHTLAIGVHGIVKYAENATGEKVRNGGCHPCKSAREECIRVGAKERERRADSLSRVRPRVDVVQPGENTNTFGQQ